MKMTIGLPCYNVAPYLEDCLKSIYAQTLTDWELIAIDDGSSDSTLQILKSQTDPRVRIISDGQNRGLAARLNEIVKEAKTSIIVRQDSDDLMFPERLEKQYAYLQKNPECQIVGTAMLSTDKSLSPCALRYASVINGKKTQAYSGNYINHATIAGRKDFFIRFPYNEDLKISEDFDLWTRSAGDIKAFNFQEPLYIYREFGLLSLAKYKAQSKLSREIILKNGPSRIGFLNSYYFILCRFIKDAVYKVVSLIFGFEKVLSLRNSVMEEEQINNYKRVISSIIEKSANN